MTDTHHGRGFVNMRPIREDHQKQADDEQAEYVRTFKQRFAIAAFCCSGVILTVDLPPDGGYWTLVATLCVLFLLAAWEHVVRSKAVDEIENRFAEQYLVITGRPPTVPLRRTLPRRRSRSKR